MARGCGEDENQEHLVKCRAITTGFWSKIATLMGALNMDASDNERKWILGVLPGGDMVGRGSLLSCENQYRKFSYPIAWHA